MWDFIAQAAFCSTVSEICSQEGFDDCGDLCYQYIRMGVITEKWTVDCAAQYCMQMIEQE